MPRRHTVAFDFPVANPRGRDVARLHAALKKLRIRVSDDDVRRHEMGDATKDAIREFQRKNRLKVDGVIGPRTIEALKHEVAHAYFARSKPRIAKLHEMLGRLGYKIDKSETNGRLFGATTEEAVKDFQNCNKLDLRGRMNEEVFEQLEIAALDARFRTKTQIAGLHRKLMRAIRIAKLGIEIDPQEVKTRNFGDSTSEAIREFQKKYRLEATGKLDPETFERLTSVVASRSSKVSMLKVRSAQDLTEIPRPLRLNMSNKAVGELQKSLSFLGYKVAKKEFDTRTFGKTTREAVIAFQRARGLEVNGHVAGATMTSLNTAIVAANPSAATERATHRVRGSVRDDLWRPLRGFRVQVWEKTLRGTGTLLAERKTSSSGFYDVPYDPPTNPLDGRIKVPCHLRIVVLDSGGNELDAKVLFNPTAISWTNFTQGDEPYRGTSQYDANMRAVDKVLDGVPLKDIEESDDKDEITYVAVNSGVPAEEVMRLALAHRAASNLADAAITADVFYAFITQSLPPSLPSDLIGGTEGWTLIDALVEHTMRGIVFMEPELQGAAFDNAASENLIPITTVRRRQQVIDALAAQREDFALEKPILIGNGSLKQVLDSSDVPDGNYTAVAQAMLTHGGLGREFWEDLKGRPGDFGGANAIDDLETSVRLGEISKHHGPTLTFLKNALTDTARPELNVVADCAKLDKTQWRALIDANGGQVPEGIEGTTADDRKDAFAVSLESQSEQQFPGVALAAQVARGSHGLTQLPQVQTLLDSHADLDLNETNLDRYFKQQGVTVPSDVLDETKLLQRVHRIAPQAKLGRALIEEKLHHSAAIVVRGRERFVEGLVAKGIDADDAITIFGHAEFQYARILTLLAEFRFELQLATPAAMVKHTYSKEEQQTLLGDSVNLEALFGATDFCDCGHCQSVYGPAAYLADVLRFLNKHNAEVADAKVLDVLFERRPDIQNIKLNCDNTNTPLPYIDLVCEILESAVPAPHAAADFSHQTTWEGKELRAFPEHVRKPVYDQLRQSDFPMDSAFDLWQEEARVWLEHLGVARHQLMETLQARPTAGGARAPLDESIAGEYFEISSHEVAIITTPADTQPEQEVFWSFLAETRSVDADGGGSIPIHDFSQGRLGVQEFLNHARLDDPKLEYRRLLELMQVKWVNGPGPGDPIGIGRLGTSCDLNLQSITNVTVDRLDRIHRFLRLWRRTGWHMWELDLLVRAQRIGNNVIDETTLTRLYDFRRVQNTLGLSFESALALFDQIHDEQRVEPDDSTKAIPSHYDKLFQNPAVSDPIEPKLDPPLDPNERLIDHKPVLLAALGTHDADITRLIERTDGKLTLPNLSLIHNSLVTARALKLTVERLLQLQDVAGIADIFATPRTMIDFIELHRRVRASGLQIDQLDFLLNLRPDSPHGLRTDSIVTIVEGLRETLRSASADPAERPGQIVDRVAALFSLPSEQTKLLLEKVTLDDPLSTVFDEPRLIERDPADDTRFRFAITDANFPSIFHAVALLHKISLVLDRQGITTTDDVRWLLDRHARFGLLGLQELPVRAQPAANLFSKWMNLAKWLELRARFPEPEDASLRAILDLAAQADASGHPQTPIVDLRQAIHALTQWPLQDLEQLHAVFQMQYDNVHNDYTSVETYLRLEQAMQAVKRLGVAAGVAGQWVLRDLSNAQAVTAQQIREAAKSKYDYTVWLDKAAPLQDVLRERKRTALIRFLVEHSLRNETPQIQFGGQDWRNPRYWEDANDLLSYFLIDVEMTSCQLTSRIKQAISSVQMFVQRCFLNREQPKVEVSQDEREDTVSSNSWRQWRYMKTYRVWEAARKVFLYPENWIEPELRDDKSSFFKAFEEELLQGELTHDHAEASFRHYLERVREVSRLEVVGAFHEVDDQVSSGELSPNVDVLHVVGRTKADPAVYYYRRFDLNDNRWTAWEKIDVDITGDQLVPVVYNRKLHLFWLVFEQKPQKNRKQPAATISNTDKPEDSPEPPQQLEIQLAWSERREDGWTSKSVSREKLIHPWERPLRSYHLKPRYKRRENTLWLDLYISTSREFNNTAFYDPVKGLPRRQLTKTRFSEAARPWHSSSFLFDGAVVGLKMKPLRGSYYLSNHSTGSLGWLTDTDSHTYVRSNFGPSGEAIDSLDGPYEIAPRLMLPDGMHYEHNRLRNNKAPKNAARLNVLENGSSRTLARGANAPFELVFSQNQIQFDTSEWGSEPLIYQDHSRSFFIQQEFFKRQIGYNRAVQRGKYKFFPFYHPYSELFLRELNRAGIDNLMRRRLQRFPHTYYPGNDFQFAADYSPADPNVADVTAERDRLDFERYGAYAIYNWEIFFHAPLMIACRLSENQRFEEAMRWFHYIFDPTNVEALPSPQRYWVTKPFFEQNSETYRQQRIENLLKDLGVNLDDLYSWRNDPFNPHRIARRRPVAYQKMVVMRYIDNLIAWGDQLFRRDSMESINEATTLYVLAYELLGPRPRRVPGATRADRSYKQLVADEALDEFGNQSVPALIENLTGPPVPATPADPDAEPLPQLDVLYFCIPANDMLLEYWDRVEDRLFKIRHCMNIAGVVRQLPLFEPPIDPAMLVKAAAAGVDISSVLSLTDVDPGQYRFRLLVAKSAEYCAEVRALGDRILSVLEKRDAEELALLRSTHETRVMDATKEVRKQQIEEAKEAIAGLEQAKLQAEARREFYRSREFINSWEGTALALSGASALAETAIAVGYILAGGLKLIPDFTAGGSGFGGTPHVVAELGGGKKVGDAAEAAVKTLRSIATSLDKFAGLASTMGSYTRRQEEWDHQGHLAELNVAEIERQIATAQIRQVIAERELENLELQIEQAKTVEDYYKSKYTNQQLYEWMLQQISTVYFQSYKLAFDMALRAETSFQFELGRNDLSYIQFGYWDSLKKGLLAGEKLGHDVRRMEAAYFEQHSRELELTKHISLARVMPLKLVELKSTGACNFDLPEWLFDMDYPGHFRRRIKSVSITIPCVTGPYTGVHATLSLVGHGVRVTEDVAGGYGDPLAPDGPRFVSGRVPVESIATSHAQNDAGMFELNFNDERYLPFEGAGSASRWQLSLPKENNQFRFDSISDVVIHIRYSAVAGGIPLTDAAKTNLAAVLPTAGFVLLDILREFGSEWHQFLNPTAGADQELQFEMTADHFPFYTQNKTVQVTELDLFLESAHGTNLDVVVTLPNTAAAAPEPAAPDAAYGNVHHWAKAGMPPKNAHGTWTMQIKKDTAGNFRELASDDVRNVYLVIQFATS